MRQAKQNQSDKAQTISFLAELTDDEAKNVMGGVTSEEQVGVPHKRQHTNMPYVDPLDIGTIAGAGL